jgi:carbon monoxide dehydrogenase subunit G
MPQREAKFTVNAPPEELWRFIRDFHSLCTCIPGVERINVLDDRTAELTVKERVGVVPLILTLRAQIDAEAPPHRLHATAKAEHLTMTIEVALRATGSGTELLSLFNVSGEGQLKAIVDRLFERRATERTAQVADCLGKRFGAASSARASGAFDGGSPGSGGCCWGNSRPRGNDAASRFSSRRFAAPMIGRG